jgi:hypothetical protein
MYVSGVSPTVNPTFPNSGQQSQFVAAVRSSVNNNTGATVVSSALQGDSNRLLLDSGEDTGKTIPLSFHALYFGFSVLMSNSIQD